MLPCFLKLAPLSDPMLMFHKYPQKLGQQVEQKWHFLFVP